MRAVRISTVLCAAASLLVSFAVSANTERLQRTAIEYEMVLKATPNDVANPPIIRGNAAMYSATTVGGPTYNRALQDCSALSGVGTGVSYHVQPFSVAVTGAYSVTMTAGEPDYDEFIFVYQNAFNPAAALTNCIAGDDDGPGGVGDPPVIASVNLTAGTSYFVVTTGFAPADDGSFTNQIAGPGAITIGGGGPTADLGITKTAPQGVLVGGSFTYVLNAINNGPAGATAVVVTDVLPAGVSFVSSTCGATAAGSTVTWNIGNLANAATASCTLTVTLAGMCTTVSNTASIDGAEADGVAANNSSTATNGGGNVVQDPGFEAGASGDSPNWTEASTNFGSPLCTVALCGTGGGTAAPRTGTVWTWFGGAGTALEVGSMQQSVIIPASATTLNFFTRFGACTGGAGDFLRVTIDGTEVFRRDSTYAGCGETAYVANSVNIAAFANGASHVLRFESTTGSAASNSNFSLDDISIAGAPMCGSAAVDLALTQSNNAGGGALLIGNTFQKTLTLTNNGPGAASAITVSDTLPPQLAFVSSTCGATAVGQVVTYTVPALANGAVNNCVLTVRVQAAGTIVNTATITASTPTDTTPANNTTTAQIGATGGGVVQAAVPALDRNMLLVLLGLVTLIGVIAMRQRQT